MAVFSTVVMAVKQSRQLVIRLLRSMTVSEMQCSFVCSIIRGDSNLSQGPTLSSIVYNKTKLRLFTDVAVLYYFNTACHLGIDLEEGRGEELYITPL